MKLIVGLGNPGKKYEKTRHNIGWQIINSFLEKKEKFKKNKKAFCFYLKKQINNQDTEIIKPLTFMNNSGQAVQYILKKHYLKPADIIVVHDDLDIDFGKIKISQNRSSAGHNGIKSIIDHLKTKNFIRLRIGIKPEQEIKIPVEDFVLKNFSKKEKRQLLKIIALSKQAIIDILEKAVNSSMTKYN